MMLVIVEYMDFQRMSGFTGTSFVLEEMFWREHTTCLYTRHRNHSHLTVTGYLFHHLAPI